MTTSERLDALQRLDTTLSGSQTCPPRSIETYDDVSMPDMSNCYGFFDPEHADKLYINNFTVELPEPDTAVETVAHEGRHAYQDHCLKYPELHPEVDAATLQAWDHNASNYISWADSYDRYLTQPVEVDAFRFGGAVREELYATKSAELERLEILMEIKENRTTPSNHEQRRGFKQIIATPMITRERLKPPVNAHTPGKPVAIARTDSQVRDELLQLKETARTVDPFALPGTPHAEYLMDAIYGPPQGRNYLAQLNAAIEPGTNSTTQQIMDIGKLTIQRHDNGSLAYSFTPEKNRIEAVTKYLNKAATLADAHSHSKEQRPKEHTMQRTTSRSRDDNDIGR